MLILALRLPYAVWRGHRRPTLGPFDESTLRMRVWPNDLDLYLHMNNGRYQTVMDLGRTDLAARTGMLRTFKERRWRPVAGSAAIRYRRSLAPLSRYELHTRIAGWEDRWFWFAQRIEQHGQLVARAYVKVAVLEDGAPVQAQRVLDALGWGDVPAPEVPEGLRAWAGSDVS